MSTIRPEYIAIAAFANLCLLIITLGVVWIALRLNAVLSLVPGAGRERRERPAKAGRKSRRSQDEDEFGPQIATETSSRVLTVPDHDHDQYCTVEQVEIMIREALIASGALVEPAPRRPRGRARKHPVTQASLAPPGRENAPEDDDVIDLD